MRAMDPMRAVDPTFKPTTGEEIAGVVLAVPPPSGVTKKEHEFIADVIYMIRNKQNAGANYQKGMNAFGQKYPGTREVDLDAPCCKWVLGALQDFANDPENPEKAALMPAVKALLGNQNFMEYAHQNGNTTFVPAMHKICDQRLNVIATEGEKVCEAQGWRKSLGECGKAWGNVHGTRLDQIVGNNELWQRLMTVVTTPAAAQNGYPVHYEIAMAVQLFNYSCDDYFDTLVRPLVEQTGGVWTHATPKNEDRMCGKLADDHKDEAEPKVCANIDGVRGGAAYKDGDSLVQGFKTLQDHPHVRILRVKNNFVQEKGNYGYRAILVNFEFCGEAGTTWKSHLEKKEVQARLQQFIDTYANKFGESMRQWPTQVGGKMFQAFTQDKTCMAVPFKYIGEVQFVLDYYMGMRKLSHIWYQIIRQEDMKMLMNDFMKFTPIPSFVEGIYN